jgi:hypothetical protein
MYAVENPAGRLVTFRVSPPVDDGNAASAAEDLRRTILAIDGPVIVCTDLTGARTFAPHTAQRFIALMKADNSKIERSAFLLGADHATVQLQVERMVREAASPARRTFGGAGELRDWLEPLLTAAEQAALAAFLHGVD